MTRFSNGLTTLAGRIRYRSSTTCLVLLVLLSASRARAQHTSALYQSIRSADSLLFDVGFNTCNAGQIDRLLADDFEFYHDQAGVTLGRAAFVNDIRNGLCRLPYKARRVPEMQTMEVFPMYRKDTLYGAVQNGFHRFYALQNGKPERFTSRARFTHLWKLEQGQWKLLRGLSYDHQDEVPADETPDFSDSAAVVAWLRNARVPALGIGLIRNGRLQQVSMYGELDSGRRAGPNAIFNVASITKTMTTMVVLRLVSAGHWDLDEPLSQYWTDPDVQSDPRSKELTTRHVLHQQSGFPNWRWELKDHKLAFLSAPGSTYGYSGEGFEYLRRALERKFHQPLDRLADSLLFRPLGMRDTHYTWSKKVDSSRLAIPHDAQGRAMDFIRNRKPNAADLVTTTIPDLAKFLIAVMNGTGLQKSIAAEMIRPAVLTKPNRSVGLCWFVYTPSGNGGPAVSHGGDDPGMHTICFWLPASKDGLIIFTNSDNGPKLFAAMLKSFWPEMGKAIVDIEMK